MQELFSSCDKHPSQQYFNINISPKYQGSRIKCIQCIYDSDNNDYKNEDYMLFQDIKENPFQFIIKTSKSNELKHFLEIKQNLTGHAIKQISNIEIEFNKMCKKFRQKISWCRKNLKRIQENQEIKLKEIMDESKVQDIIDNIDDLNYLDEQEKLSKIQDINTLTTTLIENEELKQNMKEKIQNFIDGNHQCICQQIDTLDSMKKLQYQLQINLQSIFEDTRVFESWNACRQQVEQLQKVQFQQDSQLQQEKVYPDQSQQILENQTVQLESQDQNNQISQQQQIQQPVSQISFQSNINKQDKKTIKSNNKKNKSQEEDIY